MRELDEVERALGYRFERRDLLERALTHISRARESGERDRGNQRLEFLGDTVLDLLVSELLMEAHPDAPEGDLTRARAAAVNKAALAARARVLGLGDALRLSRGEQRSGGHDKDGNLADAFEAVVAAMYLDGGLASVRGFVERELGSELIGELRDLRDAKTELQEQLYGAGKPTPHYATVGETGPPHARVFTVEVRAGAHGAVLGAGEGRSKRAAETLAAERALAALEAAS